MDDRPTDEAILAYEKLVKKESTLNTPLVSDLLCFSSLAEEYASGEDIFVHKIDALKKECIGMRTIKKDGNCFYRAFAFRFCELVRSSPGEWHEFIMTQIKDSKNILIESGYDMNILEDFCDPFFGALESGDLFQIYNTEYTSDTIVCFLRILTAAYLKKVELTKKYREEYEIFILDAYPTLEAFLAACVEPMNVESDQIHIVAMANALNITIRVYNLDTSAITDKEKAINYHEINPNNNLFKNQESPPTVCLLYRPGHYDIVYPVLQE